MSREEAESIMANYQCGQFAILETYQLRLDLGFSNDGFGEVGQQAQQQMLNDLWASVISGKSPVSKHLNAIQKALKDGDREAYDTASGQAAQACAANGTGLTMQFLPGEGG
ncbi:hypothetical protein D3226_07560 [Leucobacter chromiireducens subsp. chromiireducens]|uniref:Uncharacterized protein n=2 Tax=Leucobacter TaxID=55968 RepID=A0ABS1SNS4_9MICO|nr:hypothetical protein [Leucobacter chromiireducens subsp. chromiireducens]